MKLAWRITLLVVGLGLGIWLWLYFNPSPQEAIRRQLAKLGKAVSFDSQEGLINRAVASQDVAGFFAPEVMMNIEPRGIFPEQISRTEIAEQAFYLRSHRDIRGFKVKILDPVITLGADKESAIVELTVHAETEGERHLLVQEMRFTMRKVDDDWLIFRLDTVRTLNRLRQLPRPELFPAA